MRIIGLRAILLVTAGLLFLLHSASVSAAEAVPGARPRAALVIGNSDYSAVTALKNTANDAQDMCAALAELSYSTSCLIDLKDSREFKARIQDFVASLKPKSEVLFYYAGHAIQVKGENYLVPVNARLRTEADVVRETVSLNYIMTQLLQAKHYLNIVILDACRSNPWGAGPHALTSGLAPITAIPRGTMVMYATAANDVSDDGEGRNGTLTKNLLANIKTPGLTADEFFKHVSEGVQADSAAAVGHTQTPALYTNFTGEFCFAGCIDKVARAELERLQKANDEQLAEARREKAELQARNREAEAKLAATMTSLNCDKSVLNDSGQCFAASSEDTIKAAASVLVQRGFQVGNGSVALGRVEATRSVDDPKDKTLTNVTSITVTVKDLPETGYSVVTITANQQTLKHDEYRDWTALVGLIPLPTATEYKNIVRKDVSITDAAFFQDLLEAIDRSLRGSGAAKPPAMPAPSVPAATPEEPSTASTPPGAAPVLRQTVPADLAHQQVYAAPVEQVRQAMLTTLVGQGYIVEDLKPDFDLFTLSRKLQDPKDKHYSSVVTLSACAIATEGAGHSQVQLSANEVRILHSEPGSRLAGSLIGYTPHDNQAIAQHTATVSNAAYYGDLFAAIGATLHSDGAASVSHSKHYAATPDEMIKWASTGLQGFLGLGRFDIDFVDQNLLLAVRRKSDRQKDRLLMTRDLMTIYSRPGSAGGSTVVVSISSTQSMLRTSSDYSLNMSDIAQENQSGVQAGIELEAIQTCEQNKQCSPEEVARRYRRFGVITPDPGVTIREDEGDPTLYAQIFSILDRKGVDAEASE
jgi:hypothetical protein